LFKAKEELETRLADISLVQKQRALAKNPDINKVVKAATEINPEDIDALTPEQKAAAEKAAEQAALALGAIQRRSSPESFDLLHRCSTNGLLR